MAINKLFARRALKAQPSAIREICKLAAKTDVKSLAGGWPSGDTFPVEEVKQIVRNVLDEKPELALQYGTSEGLVELRLALAEWLQNRDGFECSSDQIMITSGSTQGIELCAKVFLEPGDAAFVGLPSYFGGIGACQAFGAHLVGVPLDLDGMVPNELEKRAAFAMEQGHRPKLLYIIPDYQNPTGAVVPLDRRRKILETASRYDMVVVEDSPYRDLSFEGEPFPPLMALDRDSRVVFLRSFSKNFCPGFRLSLLAGPEDVVRNMVIARQFEDACPDVFGQHVLLDFLKKGFLDKQIEKNRAYYIKKRDRILDLLDENFPKQVTWNRPKGGFFVFVHLPEGMSGMDLLDKAVKNNVTFVAGSAFFVDGGGTNTVRLSYSEADDESLEQAIVVLGRLLKEMIKG
ncbi:MAG: PLP-dependent aminotransferase family protein [Deltaproteobacteria bacterium]|nr:PLP-dependent aminotransferase family protein [Deltaproteobacteria bacterium]